MSDTKIPGIYAKIAAVQEAAGHVPKNGVGPAAKGSFQYVKYDDILETVRRELVKNKVITSVETVEYLPVPTQVGNRMVVNTSVLVKYTYTDIEDGSTHSSTVGGEGSDIGGDLATRKAYTQAQKIHLLQTFNIVSGDEPDADAAEPIELPDAAPAAPKQTKREEGIAATRAAIQGLLADPNNELKPKMVNDIGNELSGKSPQEWGGDAAFLKKLLTELEKRVSNG